MVYVDWLCSHGWVLRGQTVQSCHLLADTIDELHAFAAKIALKRSWFQDGSAPHYDLVASKREAAVRLGATELTKATFRSVYLRIRQQRVEAAEKARSDENLGSKC